MSSAQFWVAALRSCTLLVCLWVPAHGVYAQATCTTITPYQYAPSHVRTSISADQYSRYVYQWSWWASWDGNRLDWFKRPYAPGATFSAGTFEQDTFFYNYDGQAYGLEPAGYWATNLPYAYVDTQVFDPAEEKAVTIGTAHAYGLAPDVWYYYVTRFTSGPGSASRFKTQVQRGLREPVGCTSTYCSFGCNEPANYDRIIPFDSNRLAPTCADATFLSFGTHQIATCPL